MPTSNELAKSPKEPNLFQEKEGGGYKGKPEEVTRERSVNVLSDLFMLSSCVSMRDSLSVCASVCVCVNCLNLWKS